MRGEIRPMLPIRVFREARHCMPVGAPFQTHADASEVENRTVTMAVGSNCN